LWLALVVRAAAAQVAPPADRPPPRSLTLAEAVRTARARHPDLRAAGALTAQAQAHVDETRAPLLPQITAGAGYRHTERGSGGTSVVVGGTVVGGTGTGSALWQATLGVNQLVWDFGQTLGQLHAAESAAVAQEASGATAVATVLLNVRSFFFAARADSALVG